MTNALNLVTTISELQTRRLEDEDLSCGNERTMDLYFSHNGRLTVFGFFNSKLVWFSYTSLSDVFLSRRIFDCMKFGAFFHEADRDKALATVGLKESDIQKMCKAHVDHVQFDIPDFTGCMLLNPSEDMTVVTGEDFAEMAKIIPDMLRQSVDNVGTDDVILEELEKDYQVLEAVAESNTSVIFRINNKWKMVECLKMSKRAAIRELYYKVIYHPKIPVSDRLIT